MKLIDNFNFDVCYTKSKYNAKPTNVECASMQYIFTHTNLIEFVKRISSGYGYCSIFDNDEFGNWGKSDKYFCYTQVISIDVDHSPISLNEALDKIKTTPSMAYNTFSNGNGNNEYAFRLVYLFDEPIEGVNKTKLYLYSICKIVSDELNIKVDANAKKVSQYFNGTNDINVFVSDYVYELDDFIINENNTINNSDISKVQSKTIREEENIIDLGCTFIKDYWILPYTKLLLKYANVMKDIQNTELEIPNEDTPLIYFPKDYREIKRYWYLNENEDGDKKDYIRKIKDGDGRRKILFINGIIRRLIWNSISFQNLLYNLVFEFIHYMLNDGNKIDKHTLFNIAKNVMKADLDKYDSLGRTTRKFMVNPYYCQKYNLSKRAVINKSRSKIDYNEVGNLYDFSMTDKENIEIMKEYGIQISLRSLKEWKKKNGIAKYNKNK